MSFVELMNRKAAELGCTNTHFMNPHGLHDENHYTTAREMAAITEFALTLPYFSEITSQTSYTQPPTNLTSEARTVTTTNRMLVETAEEHYTYATGIKTGSLNESGYCIAASASYDGYSYLCICLGSPYLDADGNHIDYHGEMYDAATLFRWALTSIENKTIVTDGDLIGEVDLKYVWNKDRIQVVAKGNVTAMLPTDLDEQHQNDAQPAGRGQGAGGEGRRGRHGDLHLQGARFWPRCRSSRPKASSAARSSNDRAGQRDHHLAVVFDYGRRDSGAARGLHCARRADEPQAPQDAPRQEIPRPVKARRGFSQASGTVCAAESIQRGEASRLRPESLPLACWFILLKSGPAPAGRDYLRRPAFLRAPSTAAVRQAAPAIVREYPACEIGLVAGLRCIRFRLFRLRRGRGFRCRRVPGAGVGVPSGAGVGVTMGVRGRRAVRHGRPGSR